MRTKIQNKIDQLNGDMQACVAMRERLLESLREIETRMTQLVGAITEFKALLDDSEETPEVLEE